MHSAPPGTRSPPSPAPRPSMDSRARAAYRKAFGKRLAAAREAAGLLQADLAELLDVSDDTVGNWERGKSSPPADMVVLILQHVRCSGDHLIGTADGDPVIYLLDPTIESAMLESTCIDEAFRLMRIRLGQVVHKGTVRAGTPDEFFARLAKIHAHERRLRRKGEGDGRRGKGNR